MRLAIIGLADVLVLNLDIHTFCLITLRLESNFLSIFTVLTGIIFVDFAHDSIGLFSMNLRSLVFEDLYEGLALISEHLVLDIEV